GGEVDAGDLGDGVHDLADRAAGAAAEVVDGLQVVALGEPASGDHMGIGQVGDVDVVTHAGAVGGGVVGAVDARGPAGDERVEDQREQVVRAGVVERLRAGPDHVEVAQRGVAQTGGAGLV